MANVTICVVGLATAERPFFSFQVEVHKRQHSPGGAYYGGTVRPRSKVIASWHALGVTMGVP